MHWISTACIELGQDETAFTQAWKYQQPAFGPTGPEILAAANAEHEKGLLFAPDTVTEEKLSRTLGSPQSYCLTTTTERRRN